MFPSRDSTVTQSSRELKGPGCALQARIRETVMSAYVTLYPSKAEAGTSCDTVMACCCAPGCRCRRS